MANRNEVVRYNNQIIRVLRLHDIFNIHTEYEDPEEAMLVVVEHKKKSCAILVDSLLGKTQVVVKELGLEGLGRSHENHDILGGAIMGHGNIALVLDIEQLIGRLSGGRLMGAVN